MAKTIKSPADLLKFIRVRDQHGRMWGVQIEKETYDAASPFSPLGWRAPWTPPPRYFRLDPDNPSHVRIDYEAAVRDQKAAQQEYESRLRRLGTQLHGQAWDSSQRPTREMLDVIGDPPWRWELAEAARRGERWILGLSEVVNEKLAALLPKRRERIEDMEFDDSLLGDTEESEEEEKPARGRRRVAAGAGA